MIHTYMSNEDRDSSLGDLGYQPWRSLYRDWWTEEQCRRIWRDRYGGEIPDEILQPVLEAETHTISPHCASTSSRYPGSDPTNFWSADFQGNGFSNVDNLWKIWPDCLEQPVSPKPVDTHEDLCSSGSTKEQQVNVTEDPDIAKTTELLLGGLPTSSVGKQENLKRKNGAAISDGHSPAEKKKKVEVKLPKKEPLKLLLKKKRRPTEKKHLSVSEISPYWGMDRINQIEADAEVDFYMRSGGPPSVMMVRGVPYQYELPPNYHQQQVSNQGTGGIHTGRPMSPQQIKTVTGTPYPDQKTSARVSTPDQQEPCCSYAPTAAKRSRPSSPYFIDGETNDIIPYGEPPRLTTEPNPSAIKILNPWPSSRRSKPKPQPIKIVGSLDTTNSPAFWRRPHQSNSDTTDD